MAKPIHTTTEAEDILDQIEAAEQSVQAAEKIVDGFKEELKAAKEQYEKAVYDLRKLCRIRNEENPLLDAAE